MRDMAAASRSDGELLCAELREMRDMAAWISGCGVGRLQVRQC